MEGFCGTSCHTELVWRFSLPAQDFPLFFLSERLVCTLNMQASIKIAHLTHAILKQEIKQAVKILPHASLPT
jgi:hypothetical protein